MCWSLSRRYKETFPCILLLMCLTVTNPECCWRNQHTCLTLQIKQVYMHIWCIFQSELFFFLCWESPILQQKSMFIHFFSQRRLFKHGLCGCVYLASGRVLSSSDGPSRLSAFGDWNATTGKKKKKKRANNVKTDTDTLNHVMGLEHNNARRYRSTRRA